MKNTLDARVWTCTTFKGHYSVPVAALVIAPDSEAAAEILNLELVNVGLTGDVKPESMKPHPLIYGWVDILSDGEY